MGIRTKNINKEIVQEGLGNELMLYDAKKDEVHILNGTAKIIWEGLVAGQTEEQLEMRLREKFLIRKDHDLFLDIMRVTKEFKDKGLVIQSKLLTQNLNPPPSEERGKRKEKGDCG